MANILCDGFDQYTTGNFTSRYPWVSVGPGISVAATEIGTGKSMSVSGSRSLLCQISPTDTLISGFRTMFNGTNVNESARGGLYHTNVTNNSNAGYVFGIGYNNFPVAFRNSTKVWTGSTPLVPNQSYYFEMKTTRTSMTCRINGVVVFSDTFDDIGYDIIFAGNGGSFTAVNSYIDDYYLNDTTGPAPNNDFLGEITVYTLFPNADTADADWTLVGGATGYGILDNVGPNLSQYLETDTATATSTFDISEFGEEIFQIYTVWTNYYADKSSSADATMRANIISDITTANGDTVTLSESTPRYWRDQFSVDPNTSNPWNPATFAPQFQIERIV